MQEILCQLIELQKMDSRIAEIEAVISDMPQQVKQLTDKLEKAQKGYDAISNELAENKKAYANLENELAEKKELLASSQKKLTSEKRELLEKLAKTMNEQPPIKRKGFWG